MSEFVSSHTPPCRGREEMHSGWGESARGRDHKDPGTWKKGCRKSLKDPRGAEEKKKEHPRKTYRGATPTKKRLSEQVRKVAWSIQATKTAKQTALSTQGAKRWP